MVRKGKTPCTTTVSAFGAMKPITVSFAQFTKVQDHQLVPKPAHLSWEAAAAYMLVGATSHRMLTGWAPNNVKEDDVVLVWGGAGGIGCMAIQIAKALGAKPIAVVSDQAKIDYCMNLGA